MSPGLSKQPYVIRAHSLMPWPKIRFCDTDNLSGLAAPPHLPLQTLGTTAQEVPFPTRPSKQRRASETLPSPSEAQWMAPQRPNNRRRGTSIGSATRYKRINHTGNTENTSCGETPGLTLDIEASRHEIQSLMRLRREKMRVARREGDVGEVERLRRLGV